MSHAAKSAVILLVDDDGPIRYVTARILRGAGYEVREAATGAEALELLAQHLPDLVILDIRLPGASGPEVLRQIRANPATAALPTMYLSATFADEESIGRGLAEGADAYLTKPVTPAVLLGQVAALLRVGRANRALRGSQESLAAELATMQALHGFVLELAHERELHALLERTLEAALTITGADMGNVQLCDPGSRALRIVAHRGFKRPFLDFFAVVDEGPASCGESLRQRRRVIVEEVAHSALLAGSRAREVLLEAGVQAVQSTPLISPAGQLLGVLSTHWRRPHSPNVQVLRALDVLGRLAAGLIEQRQAQGALRQTDAELREAQRVARVGNWYWNTETDSVIVSEQTYRMLGLDPALPIAVLREREWQLYTLESQERVREAVRRALRTGEGYTLDVEARRADGSPLWLTARAEAVRDADGRIVGLRGVNQDITDRKQSEQEQERLQQRLLAAERARAEIAERMNDEIDHRVKNNLAMVSGLLQMQLLREQDPHIAGALRDAIARIRTFVTLHGQMYASRTEEADLLVALQHIAATMRELFAARGDVAISVRGDPFPCNARVATNLVVAANELVTNALKYGGPAADGRRTVAVSLHPAEDSVTISVWNSGNPIAQDVDPAQSRTLGLRLVHDMVVGRYEGRFRLCPFEGGTLAELVVLGEAIRADSAPR